MFVEDGHSVMLAQSYAKNFGLSVPIQLILPTAPGVSNEGGSSPLLALLPAVSWPWVPAWGSLEPPRQGDENAQKTGKNGGKMGETRSKKCEGVGITLLRRRRGCRAAFAAPGLFLGAAPLLLLLALALLLAGRRLALKDLHRLLALGLVRQSECVPVVTATSDVNSDVLCKWGWRMGFGMHVGAYRWGKGVAAASLLRVVHLR